MLFFDGPLLALGNVGVCDVEGQECAMKEGRVGAQPRAACAVSSSVWCDCNRGDATERTWGHSNGLPASLPFAEAGLVAHKSYGLVFLAEETKILKLT